MKAVVMAGGEGTRLRPLTSTQPKPMVPIVGRPCMEHILELVRQHGFHDVVTTLAFMPQAIRSYFGHGESLGINISYSVEESPAGTAGSVRLVADELDDTFLVISGDALCDSNLTALVDFHRAHGASATIGLKSVENPLEFGIVVIDGDGRVERFLEKPGWGQVFSDTINTGIYVLEPEVLRHVPTDRPFDFSKELFPLLLEMGRPIYGMVLDGYWQDVGNLDQYRQANFDALDGKVRLKIPGIRLRGNVWAGQGVEVDDLDRVSGPAFIGNYCRVAETASLGAYVVLSNSVTVREHAQVRHSIIDASTYVGRGALVEGAIVGRSCDVRARARVLEGAAIGDESVLGDESVVMPGIRIYPFKAVESGTQVDRNLIWESRAAARSLFGRGGVSGLINVDLTPDTAVRLGTALGTALERGARVVASRAATRACRVIKRALVAGITSTGVSVTDLRLSPPSLNRHLLRRQTLAVGVHVTTSAVDPEAVEIQIFEAPGVQMGADLEKDIAKHFSRQEFRRSRHDELGDLTFATRASETYVHDVLETLDIDRIRARGFRAVVDYSHSPTALILPAILAPLGIEVVASRTEIPERLGADAAALFEEAQTNTKRLVSAIGADLGVALDNEGERISLVDETGATVPDDLALLLFVSLVAGRETSGRLAVPVTTTQLVEKIVSGSGLDVTRTEVSLAALTLAATEEDVVFAGTAQGRFIFPQLVPAPAAGASIANLLDLLALRDAPLSQLVGDLPRPNVVHRTLHCPWSMKGTVMRVLTEQAQGRETDVLDGIKVFENSGWAQAIPDPYEPIVHVYAEAETPEGARRLEESFRTVIESVIASSADAGSATRNVT